MTGWWHDLLCKPVNEFVFESCSCGFFLHPFLMNKLEKYLGQDFSGLTMTDGIFFNYGLCIRVLLKQLGGVVQCASSKGGTLLVKITNSVRRVSHAKC